MRRRSPVIGTAVVSSRGAAVLRGAAADVGGDRRP
jgi:hypothetical protein